ncbi:MAG: tetratricopeptide repeat protein, partial [Candidatus Omnitrophota bacterium]|nr:tetratricopeptide repeat protein [Candidatus Omnitrophota bacterium]
MRITNIKDNEKLKLTTQKLKFRIIVSAFILFLLSFLSGCTQKNELKQAQDYLKKSKIYYQHATDLYKDLIAKGKNLDKLHFELGQLYYNQGEWKQAIEEFKKTNILVAKKFLAISYYRLGNFTDALEVFNREEVTDDEYLYYHGLTSEKLNLFDQALSIYKKIKTKEFAAVALERLNIIEKQTGPIQIKDISPQVHKILEAAPTQDKYPQAGALILFCDEKIEVTPQNTQVSTLHYIIKILNERG